MLTYFSLRLVFVMLLTYIHQVAFLLLIYFFHVADFSVTLLSFVSNFSVMLLKYMYLYHVADRILSCCSLFNHVADLSLCVSVLLQLQRQHVAQQIHSREQQSTQQTGNWKWLYHRGREHLYPVHEIRPHTVQQVQG